MFSKTDKTSYTLKNRAERARFRITKTTITLLHFKINLPSRDDDKIASLRGIKKQDKLALKL